MGIGGVPKDNLPLVATVAKDFLCHSSKKREDKGNILPQLNLPDTTTAAKHHASALHRPGSYPVAGGRGMQSIPRKKGAISPSKKASPPERGYKKTDGIIHDCCRPLL